MWLTCDIREKHVEKEGVGGKKRRDRGRERRRKGEERGEEREREGGGGRDRRWEKGASDMIESSYHRVYPSSSLGGDRTLPESIHSLRDFPFGCLCQQPLCQVHFVRAFWTKTSCPRVELQCRLITNFPQSN